MNMQIKNGIFELRPFLENKSPLIYANKKCLKLIKEKYDYSFTAVVVISIIKGNLLKNRPTIKRKTETNSNLINHGLIKASAFAFDNKLFK